MARLSKRRRLESFQRLKRLFARSPQTPLQRPVARRWFFESLEDRTLLSATILDANFDNGTNGFAFVDDTFRNTSEPAYAYGDYYSQGGFTGGGLNVQLGGTDGNLILGISGGWQSTFTLTSDAEVTLSFRYELIISGGYESDEYGEVLVTVGSLQPGSGGNDYVDRLYGQGGGPAQSTNWQLFQVNLGTLAAGTHTLTIGGYNNKKNANNETTTINLDDVLVQAANFPPVANNQSVSTNEDTAVGITLTGSDADGDPLTYSVVTGPANGALSGTGPNLTYTPAANFNGSDSFTFQVNDGTTDSNTATVSITVSAVNDAPTASADSYSVNEDTTLNVAASGVLANDSDVDGDSLSAALVSGPSNGTLTLNADGSFTYTPSANFNGSDSFTYQASDGSASSNVATVSITVNPTNDAPVAANDNYTVEENGSLSVNASSGVLTNDTDVEGDTLSAILVSGPSNGSLTLNADGSFIYTPNPNFTGTDSFTYKANDGTADSNNGTVTLTVTASGASNNAPTATADTYSVNEDTTLSGAASGVLANDSDADGDPLSAVLVSGPSKGTLTLNADGSFTYTPNANFNGTDSFTYQADDGTASSNVATVTITVSAVNDAPVALDGSFSVAEDTTLNVAASGVLANDTDTDGDMLSAILVSGPSNGTLTLGADGAFTYTPNANFTGTDSFSYLANDEFDDSNIATVSITVNPVNDAQEEEPADDDDSLPWLVLSQVMDEEEPTDFAHTAGEGSPPSSQTLLAAAALTGAADTASGPPLADRQPARSDSRWPASSNPEELSGLVDGSESNPHPDEADSSPHANTASESAPQSDSGAGLVSTNSANSEAMAEAAPKSPPAMLDAVLESIEQAWELESDGLWEQFDSLTAQIDSEIRSRALENVIASGVITSMSVGYVILRARSDALLAGSLTATPLWRQFDPLAILDAWEKQSKNQRRTGSASRDEEDDLTLESLVG